MASKGREFLCSLLVGRAARAATLPHSFSYPQKKNVTTVETSTLATLFHYSSTALSRTVPKVFKVGKGPEGGQNYQKTVKPTTLTINIRTVCPPIFTSMVAYISVHIGTECPGINQYTARCICMRNSPDRGELYHNLPEGARATTSTPW